MTIIQNLRYILVCGTLVLWSCSAYALNPRGSITATWKPSAGGGVAALSAPRWDGGLSNGTPSTHVSSCYTVEISSGYSQNAYSPCIASGGRPLNNAMALAVYDEIINSDYLEYEALIYRTQPDERDELRLWIHDDWGGYYDVYLTMQWHGSLDPVNCTATSGPINLPPVANDIVASATAPMTVRCNATADFVVTVGTAGGGATIPYTPGGDVRMSFDQGLASAANVYRGHVDGAGSVDTTVRATTVPGVAPPGKYNASAVVTIALE